MLSPTAVFSGFSVSDMEKTKEFYGTTLGFKVESDPKGLHIELPGGGQVFVYQKDNHEPASFTILNIVVANIDSAVDELLKLGVTFERYENMPQDERGIARGLAANMGPDIAWFKDPAGNILAILQDAK